jgi:polyisoprenoid-binding protein YceI
MKAMFFLTVAPLLLAGNAHAGEWRLDPAHTELVVQLYIDGLASSFGHDHVVRATEVTSQMQLDPEAGTGSIQMIVKTATLRADEPWLRTKYHLKERLDADEIHQVEKAMKAEDQLDVEHHPTIIFQSTQVQKQSENAWYVAGNLTIHGKTEAVRFVAEVDIRDSRMAARGHIRFKQSAFGYEPYSSLLGALKLKDDVLLTVEFAATRVQ